MKPIYKVNPDFDIKELLNERYGFKKANDRYYAFSDLTVPIIIDTETRRIDFGGCLGITSVLVSTQIKETLLEEKIIICESYNVQAKCVKESNKEGHWLKHDLEVGKFYDVEDIQMGQSHTSIYLKDKKFSYNSVIFEFYENDKQIDIYKDERFNPYLRHKN